MRKRGDKTAGALVKRGGKGVKRTQKIRILKKRMRQVAQKTKERIDNGNTA